MNTNKKSNGTAVVIIGVILFILTIFLQGSVTRIKAEKGIDLSSANGIISQIQVLISVIMVVIAHKKGFIASTILNLGNSVYVLAIPVLLGKNFAALPGAISPAITVVTCIIIYSYHVKAKKANEELQKTNSELIETNRVIREKDEKLIYLAYYDVLTGLANRQLFIEHIDEKIERDSAAPFTVIFANIDDFKLINDTFGHNTGDIILSTYADRLRAFCGESVFISKIGGDEFAVVINGEHNEPSVMGYLENLCAEVLAPVTVNGRGHQTTMSFGVASFPRDGRNSTELLRSTDIAVTNAKAMGKGRTCFYIPPQY